MNALLGGLLAAAALVPIPDQALAASSQTGTASADSGITTDRARRFVAQLTIPGANDEPFARFAYPVCVGSAGLPPEAGEVVAERITAIAASSGLPIAESGCAPNLMVVFVEDGRAAVRALSRAGSGALVGQSRADIGRILDRSGPVRAWLQTQVRSRDGDRPSYSPTGLTTLTAQASTRLSASIRREIVSSVVLIAREAIADRDLRQVADYAAMRGLTGARLDESPAMEPTILTLFTPHGDAAAPAGLTAEDRAFLSAFHIVRDDMAETLQRPRIVDRMARVSLAVFEETQAP
ncbi:MAG: hypothetical protein DI555_00060 [Novosphingobium pentaromativorans]|uniref:DUF2927 domain-containing protein n=1 Tax=Novosphingobium pentaromativorans TaxID=205844 RepID=A0A2W5NWQ2_9SPHN|nr:hypothetical protein [Novosphingobium panipatense]PZQ57384.1 MAG: hypothetical protein DI555_00060 [Novosphingobium pentaromativorans]